VLWACADLLDIPAPYHDEIKNGDRGVQSGHGFGQSSENMYIVPFEAARFLSDEAGRNVSREMFRRSLAFRPLPGSWRRAPS
jgi:hypothetical protein